MEIFFKERAIFEPAAKEWVGYAFDSTKGYPGEGPAGVARHLHGWITVNVAGAHIVEKNAKQADDGAQKEHEDTLRYDYSDKLWELVRVMRDQKATLMVLADAQALISNNTMPQSKRWIDFLVMTDRADMDVNTRR